MNFFNYTHLNISELNAVVNYSALYFALLPFWPFGGLSIAGMLLILNAFLNVLNKTLKWRDAMIILLYPFYSYFIFSNAFVILLLSGMFLYYLIRNKKFHTHFFVALAVFTALCIITEYRVIYSSIQGFESHRHFFNQTYPSIGSWISSSIQSILNNHEFYFYSYSDSVSRHYPLLLLITLLVLFMTFLFHQKKYFFTVFSLLFLTVVFAYLYPLSSQILYVLQKITPSFLFRLIQGFTFRFYVLNPVLWLIILFSIGVYISSINARAKLFIVNFLFLFNAYLLFTTGKTLNFNTYRALESPFANNIKNKTIPITYQSYFDTELFHRIDTLIQHRYQLQKHQYRVAALTDPNPAYPLFSPAVLQYNGFFTIDGYCVYYPKSYK
ncbi:MAG: DUF6044 family protein, partial [Bacteroidia bacterium]|nr:DUF6044 family protein [Bacteroidia bacterium]